MPESRPVCIGSGYGCTITFYPEEDLGLVILKRRWVADNGYEAASFATEDEARRFAHVRWGLTGPEMRTDISRAPAVAPGQEEK